VFVFLQYVYILSHKYKYTYLCLQIYMRMFTYIFSYICIYTLMYSLFFSVLCVFSYTLTYMYECMYTPIRRQWKPRIYHGHSGYWRIWGRSMHYSGRIFRRSSYMCAHTYIWIFTCICTCIYSREYTYESDCPNTSPSAAVKLKLRDLCKYTCIYVSYIELAHDLCVSGCGRILLRIHICIWLFVCPCLV